MKGKRLINNLFHVEIDGIVVSFDETWVGEEMENWE